MKKILALSFIAVLMLSLAFSLIPLSLADHDATLLWIEDFDAPYERSSTTVYRPALFTAGRWPWLNFTVECNEGSIDPIYKLIFEIPKNGTGYAEFHYWRSIIYDETGAEAEQWHATPDEIDNSGWPTVVIFENEDESNPIKSSETFRFCLEFKNIRVKTCDRTFYIYTVDKGTISQEPETQGHELFVITDPDAPENPNMISPTSTEGTSADNPIIAIFDPYPGHWYMELEFTVRDKPRTANADHDTGISRVEVFVDDQSWVYPEEGEWFEPQLRTDINAYRIKIKVWDLGKELAPGTFKFPLTINIFDGARNERKFYRDFWFKIPSYFRISPHEGTVGRFDNKQNSLKEWEGSISDEYTGTLGYYQLGTEVTVEGLEPPSPLIGFTPNSMVNVYVYLPPTLGGKSLVCKNVPTNDRGVFKSTFLFLKAPSGIYKVEAEDLKGIKDFSWFEVKEGVIFMPDAVTGPARVEVIASGLPADADEYDIFVDRFFIDDLDAILSVNDHTIKYWYVDKWGVLHSTMADNDARGLPQQGFLLPLLESGKYEIAFRVEGQRWERGSWMTRKDSQGYHKPSFDTQVITRFDEIFGVLNNTVVPIITKIDDDQTTIVIDTLGEVKADTDDIILRVSEVKKDTVTINATIKDLSGWTQELHGWVEEINGDWTTVRTEVGDVKLETTEILKKLNGDFTLSDPSMIAAVLSAIAAIAAIISVVVVVKRLKVAA